MQQTFFTNAIVIKKRDHKEVDRFYTLITEGYGKVTALGKATRRTTTKMAGHLEPGTVCQVMIARGRHFDRIAGVKTLGAVRRLPLAERLDQWLLFELLDRLVQEGQTDPPLYSITREFLDNVNDNRELHVTFYVLRIFEVLGYGVRWDHCQSCNQPLPAEPFLGAAHAGLLCTACAASDRASQQLQTSVVRLLQQMTALPWGVIAQYQPNASVKTQMQQLTWTLLHAHIQRPLLIEPFYLQIA